MVLDLALIKCPVCGHDVSDRATRCSACGSDLSPFRTGECVKCGARFIPPVSTCPECGSAISIGKTHTKFDLSKWKRSLIIVVSIIAIAVIICVVAPKLLSANNYQAKFMDAASTIFDKSEDAAGLLGQICDAWSATDRDTAVTTLWADHTFADRADLVIATDDIPRRLVEELQDAPAEYSDVYAALEKSYDGYVKLINLLENPSGDLSSYVSNIDSAIDDVIDNYEIVRDYFG